MKYDNLVNKVQNFNICIIEKNNQRRRFIESILNSYGFYRRSFYNNTQDALDSIMSGTSYNLVLIDWKIKNVPNAKKFCMSVKKLNIGMPVIFITSKSLTDYYEAFEAGATNIIKSPFDEHDFMEAIWSAVKIEDFRWDIKEADLHTTKKFLFFRLKQSMA